MALRKYFSIALILILGFSFIHAAPSIRVMGLFKNTAIVNLNGTQRILKVGKPAVDGVTLISADHKKAVVEYQGQKQTLTIDSQAPISLASAPTSSANNTPRDQTMRLTRQPDGMYRVKGLINGSTVNFLVDTGATSIAMNHITADRIGIPFRQTGKLIQAKTASGIVNAYAVMLKKVRVGEIEMQNVAGAVLISEQPDEVLLGMSFLGRLEIKQDGRQMMFNVP